MRIISNDHAPRTARSVLKTIARNTAILILVIAIGFLALLLIGRSMSPKVTTSVRDYKTALAKWPAAPHLVAHFPPEVPPHAGLVRFSAWPGGLQSAAYIQLRLQLPAEEINQIALNLKQATTRAYTPDEVHGRSSNDLPLILFHTANNPSTPRQFPSHYTLYVLHVEDRSPPGWIHGSACGVAVSRTRNDVVYWAVDW